MSGITVVSNGLPSATEQGQSDVETKETKPAATVDETVETSEESAALEASDETEETETEGAEGDEPEGEPELQAAKPKKGFKKRIDKLRSQLTQREQELEYLRQELAKKSEPKREEPQAVKKETNQVADGKPNPDNFETHTEYLEAVADWKLDQREAKQREAQAQEALKKEVQTKGEAYQSKVKEFKAQAKDWDDVLEEVSHVNVPFVVQDEILNSELGPELTYELAKDAEEFERICKLPANQAIKAIAIVEHRILSGKSEAKPKPEIKTTKAPKPISPVSSQSSGSVKKKITDPSLSQAEYEALRREQLAKKAQYY